MIIEPIKGILVCEVVPEENIGKKYIKLPAQKIGNAKIAVLKALIDPYSKEIVKTDYVKFEVKKGNEDYAYINKESFETLCDLYLSENNYENVYAIFESPEKIWARYLRDKKNTFSRKIDEKIIEMLKDLEYV
ncbi:MAG TPA: hypothetical protein EYH56_01465 [Nanoarchaeota archaeon]|nr:hypothetical protein [Nanoarchaeota archaeon]